MSLKKKWYIILTNTEGSNVVNASFSKHSGLFAIIALTVFSLMVVGSLFFLIRWHTHFPQIEKVQAENRILRNELDGLVTEIDSISFRLKQMQEWEDELRIERNIEAVNREIRQMGIGGLPHLEANYSELSEDLNLNLNITWKNIREVDLISSFAHQNRKELVSNISLQSEMYRYTPSIYPAFGRITTPFGWRTHPITGRRDFHGGLDIANGIGSPIYATADGTVKEVSYNRYYGNFIVVTHKFGYETMYAHLRGTQVSRGDAVTRGDVIGTMGSTGRSTGSHLHYEVRRYRRAQNPYNYLNKMEYDVQIASN